MIGDSMLRVEDLPLLTGAGRFAADIRLDRETHLRVVRSPVPHGILRGIDVSAAKAIPGVLAVPGGVLKLPVRAEAVLALLRSAGPGSTSASGGI